MKYIILFILLLWITKRVIRIFSAVSQDQSSGQNPDPFRDRQHPGKSQEGEFADYEEIE